MELLNKNEIEIIVKNAGFSKVLHWFIEDYSDKLIGYLGDHLKLTIDVELKGTKSQLKLFMKCMPRFDKWKAEYLKELTFFKKEYMMLNKLFSNFANNEGLRKWRPKLLFAKEDLFVFEDVSEMGYVMADQHSTLTYDELLATVETLARFHAQSYIYEEKKIKDCNRPYRIWEDFNEYLYEPTKGKDWRNAGKNAVIDFLKVYSKYKSKPNFSNDLEDVHKLFDEAFELMKPNSEYRNVVIHRDLWSNNIFLKVQENKKPHALIIDFQTVLYSSPMLDLSSLIYFNTTRKFRDTYVDKMVDAYYKVLSEELSFQNIEISSILNKIQLINSYEESLLFGITQAAIIVPLIAMSHEQNEKYCSSPESREKMCTVSRSEEFIEIAKVDVGFRDRVIELFDEILEKFIYKMTNI